MGAGDILRLVFALIAACIFVYAGMQMGSIRSIGGNSLVEAGFQAEATMYYGFALLSVAIGMPRSQATKPK